MSRPITGEPTHTDADGVTRPGPDDLRSDVTPTKIENVEEVQAEHYKDADKRNRYSASNPQTGEPYASLQTLAYSALREYGEMNPGTLDGDTILMFIGFANKIIEDMRAHPYFDMPDLDYYVSQTEHRPIPDILMIEGLQHYYALQQFSSKAQLKSPAYFARLNTVLYNRKFGNGKIEVEPRR